MLRISTLLLSGVAWMSLPNPAFPDSDEWLIPQEQARCLFENLPRYQSSTADPVVIFVIACPVVDPTEALESLQTNNALPAVRESSNESAIDEVIVYTLEELRCLKTGGIDTSDPIVGIPKAPCG